MAGKLNKLVATGIFCILLFIGGIPVRAAEPQYLIFWGYPSQPIEVQMQNLIDRVGRGDGTLHILGYGASIPVFIRDEQQRQVPQLGDPPAAGTADVLHKPPGPG